VGGLDDEELLLGFVLFARVTVRVEFECWYACQLQSVTLSDLELT
jgi:hypothetical protein